MQKIGKNVPASLSSAVFRTPCPGDGDELQIHSTSSTGASCLSRLISQLFTECTYMAIPRVLVLRAPGSNCDGELQFAFNLAGGQADLVHINRLRENPKLLKEYQVLAVPGGFTY